MKAYLNPHDRFANRMKASLSKRSGAEKDQNGITDETKQLFVDSDNIDVNAMIQNKSGN